MLFGEIMPLGGYQGFPDRKAPGRSIAHTIVAAGELYIVKLELTPLQTDKSSGLLLGNNAIYMIDPVRPDEGLLNIGQYQR
jgi:hypothetical protein